MAHGFISYVRENGAIVERLCDELRQQGIEVWLDRDQIRPGERWRQAIRQAIEHGAFFLACFSKEYTERETTYMNEELTLAIDELRKHPTDHAWFIPVLFSECRVPEREIGGGETLRHLQWVAIWENWQEGVRRIVSTVKAGTPKKQVASAVSHASNQSGQSSGIHQDLSDQAILILRQFVESGDQQFFYMNLGDGRWSMQLCHGEQKQIEVTEPRFIEDDLNHLVDVHFLTVETNADGSAIYGITRRAVRYIQTTNADNAVAVAPPTKKEKEGPSPLEIGLESPQYMCFPGPQGQIKVAVKNRSKVATVFNVELDIVSIVPAKPPPANFPSRAAMPTEPQQPIKYLIERLTPTDSKSFAVLNYWSNTFALNTEHPCNNTTPIDIAKFGTVSIHVRAKGDDILPTFAVLI